MKNVVVMASEGKVVVVVEAVVVTIVLEGQLKSELFYLLRSFYRTYKYTK